MAAFGIVADDLTGACGAGVQFAKQGLATIVFFELADVSQDAEVTVLDTESRLLSAADARSAAFAAASALKRAGTTRVFKKIDSTLRGNIGAELDGTLNALDTPLAVVAPAVPSNRRTTVGGRVLIDNIQVSETSFARDAFWPIRESSVAAVIGTQSAIRTRNVPLAAVQSGADGLHANLRKLVAGGARIAVVDAETAEDLDTIGRAIAREPWLPVGSDGLAAAWSAHQLPERGKHPENPLAILEKREGRVLVVVGSLNPACQEQIAQLVAKFPFDRLEVPTEGPLPSPELVSNKSRVLLITWTDAARETRVGIGGTREERRRAGMALVARLGAVAATLARREPLAGLVLSGGDTALAVCRALGGVGLRPYGEVEPGVPVSALVGGQHEGAPVLTKPGGFGTPLSFVRSVEFLKGR